MNATGSEQPTGSDDPRARSIRGRAYFLAFLLAPVLCFAEPSCLYMVDESGGPVLVVNTRTLVVRHLRFGGVLALDIAIVGSKAFIAYQQNALAEQGMLAIIDLATRTMVGTIPVGRFPMDIEPIQGRLYVASLSENRVYIVDAESYSTRTIDTCRGPVSLSASRDGTRLYVGCQAGQVDIVGTAGNTLVQRVKVRPGVKVVLAVGDYLLVGTSGLEVRDVSRSLALITTMFADHLISDVTAHGTRVIAGTLLGPGFLLFGDLTEPSSQVEWPLFPGGVGIPEQDIPGVLFAPHGEAAYVSSPGSLFVFWFPHGQFPLGPMAQISTNGRYSRMALGPCPSLLPTATPRQSPPASVPAATVTPTATSTATKTASVSPTLTPRPPATATPTATGTGWPGTFTPGMPTSRPSPITPPKPGTATGGCSLGGSSSRIWMVWVALLALWRFRVK